jgi:hypothetical protein
VRLHCLNVDKQFVPLQFVPLQFVPLQGKQGLAYREPHKDVRNKELRQIFMIHEGCQMINCPNIFYPCISYRFVTCHKFIILSLPIQFKLYMYKRWTAAYGRGAYRAAATGNTICFVPMICGDLHKLCTDYARIMTNESAGLESESFYIV